LALCGVAVICESFLSVITCVVTVKLTEIAQNIELNLFQNPTNALHAKTFEMLSKYFQIIQNR
jgi:hypothetical protein